MLVPCLMSETLLDMDRIVLLALLEDKSATARTTFPVCSGTTVVVSPSTRYQCLVLGETTTEF